MKYKELVVGVYQDMATLEQRECDGSCIETNAILASIPNHVDGIVALQYSGAVSTWHPRARRFMPAPTQLDRLRVVLVSPRNPLNIGAAARAMSNFGFHSLRVVNPFEPSFREARSAVGASHLLESAEQFATV